MCEGTHNKPEVITDPQTIKIEAPGTEVYEHCEIDFKAPAGKVSKFIFSMTVISIVVDLQSLFFILTFFTARCFKMYTFLVN